LAQTWSTPDYATSDPQTYSPKIFRITRADELSVSAKICNQRQQLLQLLND
jgi:hypothetical protein